MSKGVPRIVPDDPDEEGSLENGSKHPYSSRPISQQEMEIADNKLYDKPSAWLVCIAGFLTQAWVFGVILNFSIFFKQFQVEFQADESAVTWIGSLLWSLFLAGPLVSMAVIRLGSMTAVILGALLTSIGFLASSFAWDLYQLYATYGFLIGCGMGFPFLASYSVLGDYFRRHLKLATCIVTIGGGVGMSAFAALFEYLVEVFDWRGCLLINSGIALHLIPLGMLMKSRKRDMSKRVPGIKEMLGVGVLKIAKFRWMLLHMLLWNIGLNVMFIHLIKVVSDHAQISISEAIMVAIVQGIFNTAGRCLAIPLLYQRFFDFAKVYAVTATLMGLFEMLMVSATTQMSFMIMSSCVAVNFGLMLSYLVPVFVELVGVENISPALGYSNLVQGIGGIMGPPLIDLMVHGVKIFFVGGVFTTFGGLAAVISVYMHFRQKKAESKKRAIAAVMDSNEHDRHAEHSGLSA